MFPANRILFTFLFLSTLLHWGCNPSFVIRKSAEGIEVRESGKKVLFYQVRPKTVDGKYERAGYVHPLYDLNEGILTEDAPEDHPYHRGIFWAWHQILIKGQPVANSWVSEHIAFVPEEVTTEHDHAKAVIRSALVWKQIAGTDTLADLVRETTTITIHPATTQYRAVDFNIHLLPLADSLAIGGAADAKGYGGFCWRLKLPEEIVFRSQDTSVVPQETAVPAGPWMDFTGAFSNSTPSREGIAVFSAIPYPEPEQWWILRSKNSMQNAVFPGSRAQLLPKEGWTLQYRLIVHDTTVKQEELEYLYQQYAGK